MDKMVMPSTLRGYEICCKYNEELIKPFENIERNKSILNELEDIKPLQNEENDLVERRSLISNSTKIVNAVNDALGKLNGEDSVIKRINNILNSLEKTNFTKNQQITEIIETLLRASNELEEGNGLLQHFQNTLNTDPQELDNIDISLYNPAKLDSCSEGKFSNLEIDNLQKRRKRRR